MSTGAPSPTQATVASTVPAQPAPWNVLAIIGFVLVFVMPVGAIVCGHIALGQIKRTREQGYELAMAATILGWVLTAAIGLVVLVWLGFMLSFLGVFLGVVANMPQGALLTP